MKEELLEHELRILNYEQLKTLLMNVRSKIITNKNERKNCTDLEIYFCYIQKAMQDAC